MAASRGCSCGVREVPCSPGLAVYRGTSLNLFSWYLDGQRRWEFLLLFDTHELGRRFLQSFHDKNTTIGRFVKRKPSSDSVHTLLCFLGMKFVLRWRLGTFDHANGQYSEPVGLSDFRSAMTKYLTQSAGSSSRKVHSCLQQLAWSNSSWSIVHKWAPCSWWLFWATMTDGLMSLKGLVVHYLWGEGRGAVLLGDHFPEIGILWGPSLNSWHPLWGSYCGNFLVLRPSWHSLLWYWSNWIPSTFSKCPQKRDIWKISNAFPTIYFSMMQSPLIMHFLQVNCLGETRAHFQCSCGERGGVVVIFPWIASCGSLGLSSKKGFGGLASKGPLSTAKLPGAPHR